MIFPLLYTVQFKIVDAIVFESATKASQPTNSLITVTGTEKRSDERLNSTEKASDKRLNSTERLLDEKLKTLRAEIGADVNEKFMMYGFSSRRPKTVVMQRCNPYICSKSKLPVRARLLVSNCKC